MRMLTHHSGLTPAGRGKEYYQEASQMQKLLSSDLFEQVIGNDLSPTQPTLSVRPKNPQWSC